MPESLPLLALALLLDGLLPWPFAWSPPHPVVWFGWLIATLEGWLNRPGRNRFWLMFAGSVLMAVLLAIAIAAGLALESLADAFAYGWLIEVAVIAVMLAQRSLYRYVRAVAVALRDGGLPAGRDAVAHIVGRDPAQLDKPGVARAAIESLAENLSDGVVAPAFWAALFGLPGMLAYKAVNTADSMIGHKTARFRHFGWPAAWTDDGANLVPARIAGLLIVLAVPHRLGTALATMWRDADKHRSPNAGWPEAAMAGALGLRLNGPRYYGDDLAELPWLGDGREDAGADDIDAALKVYVRACMLLLVLALLWWLY
ncbi:MAG: adenosylcobinamide-phosphate synthase CbiB [Alphaproteobacteria bacterium]